MRNEAIRCQISTSTKVAVSIFALLLTVFEILTFQMFDLENLGQGHRVKVAVMPFVSIKVVARTFTLALTVSEILRF